LLLIEDEDPSSPPARLGYGGHAYHHTTVVVDHEPAAATLQEFLFHLRRAYGQKNRPPPAAFGIGIGKESVAHNGTVPNSSGHKEKNEKIILDHSSGPHGSLDKILVPRMNRYVGISREGIVCITWSADSPVGSKQMSFDVSNWHKKFQGIYLILSLHAHGERAVLEELSTLAAVQADSMKYEYRGACVQKDGTGFPGETMDPVEKSRNQMKELATLVARFTIAMSSDDCGGPSEYSEFFTTLRRVFGIPTQRGELREELQDTLALLDSGYLEERRRRKQEDQREERMERERIRKLRLMKEANKHKYDTIFSAISSLTIPAVLLSSLWGMNIEDLPRMRFWEMLGIMGLCSLVALVVQLLCFRGMGKDTLNDEIQRAPQKPDRHSLAGEHLEHF